MKVKDKLLFIRIVFLSSTLSSDNDTKSFTFSLFLDGNRKNIKRSSLLLKIVAKSITGIKGIIGKG